LLAEGERVERVVMLDVWGPTMVSSNARRRMSRFGRRLRTERSRFVTEKLRAVLRAPIAHDAEWETLAAVSDFSLGEVVIAAAKNYGFQPIDADVTLINAMREPFTRYLPADYGWKGLARNIEVREVETFHLNMCQGTNARKVMAAIDASLG
jgi:thioesterase domain-containing protein